MAAIDYRTIRPHQGSQQEAFEELTSQLFSLLPPHIDAQWIRKRGAGGDGGVEAYWTLPDGTEECLQAKYFFDLDKSRPGQMTSSVKKMLEAHPCCTKYIIAIPFNLTDGRVEARKSERDRWKALVVSWKKLAPNRDLEFVLWDETFLNSLLMLDEPRFSGRRRYWFDNKCFSHDWFKKQWEQAAANLGGRYTPELHVDIALARKFDAVMRHSDFWDGLSAVPTMPNLYGDTDEIKSMEADVHEQFEIFRATILKAEKTKKLGKNIEIANAAAHRMQEIVDLRRDKGNWFDNAIDADRNAYFRLTDAVSDCQEHLDNNFVGLAEASAIYLTGEAGAGKSHLLADVTRKAIHAQNPAILILGQQLQAGLPWPFILGALSLNWSVDEFLGALDAAAQAKDCRAVLAIDALNEGKGNEIWPDSLAGLAKKVSEFSHIALIVACRKTYNRRICRNLSGDEFTTLQHFGFAGHEEAAARSFMDGQGISRPEAPFLDPEFSNPLFLKTTCEALKRQGATTIPKGLRGLTAIFEFYIDSVSDAIENRLNLDPDIKAVQQVVRALLDAMLDSKVDYVPYDRARKIADNILASNGDADRNLIRQLKTEGLLTDDVVYLEGNDDVGSDVIRMSYERFLDYFRAERFVGDHYDPQNPGSAFKVGGAFYDQLGKNIYDRGGFIEALSVQIPEKFRCELIGLVEIAKNEKNYQLENYLKEGFSESLCWRAPQKVNSDTIRLLNEKLGGLNASTFEILLRVAIDPDHVLNGWFLHRNLSRFEMAERDKLWTNWIVGQWYTPDEAGIATPVWRLIDWAINIDGCPIDDERRFLGAITLAWFLASPNRSLRDQATKALVALLGTCIKTTRRLILSFDKINDYYILSRVYAAAYAVALRVNSTSVAPLARTIANRVFRGNVPCNHILVQDCILGVLNLAASHNCAPKDISDLDVTFQKQSEWPLESVLPSQVEELKDQVDCVYWSVMSGDFGTYVMNDVFCFSITPISETALVTFDQRWQTFMEELSSENPKIKDLMTDCEQTQKQEEVYEDLKPGRTSIRLDHGSIKISESDGSSYDPDAHEKARLAHLSAERALTAALSEDQADTLRWLKGARKDNRPAIFSRRAAKRWVVKRVADLGYSYKKFESYERTHASSHGRNSHRNERMGKKYQWIAFHQLMANLAANVQYLGRWAGDAEERYKGAWDLGIRDIDPTLPIKPLKTSKQHAKCWWLPELTAFEEKLSYEQGAAWVRDTSSLPPNFCGCEYVDPQTGRPVLLLDAYQQVSSRSQGIRTDGGLQIQSHTSVIISKNDAVELIATLKGTNLSGVFHCHRDSSSGALLLEYPWHESWGTFKENYTTFQTQRGGNVVCHFPYHQYSHESSGYDKSMDRDIWIKLPSPALIEGLGLKLDLHSMQYVNDAGLPVFYDPGLLFDRKSSAVVDKASFSKWLIEEGYILATSITLMRQFTHGPAEKFAGETEDCQFVLFDGHQHSGYRWTMLTESGPKESVFRAPFKMSV